MISIMDAYEDFVLSCITDGLSKATIEFYRYSLNWLCADYGQVPLTEISARMIRRHILEIQDQRERYIGAGQRPELPGQLSIETIRAKVRGLKRFFNWAFKEYDLDPERNPMSKIRMPHGQDRTPKAITPQDVRRLLDACPNTAVGHRDKALLAFLADTGCRAGGALTLTLDRLNLERDQAVVFEKRQKRRIVPFTAYTAQLIQTWLQVRPAAAATVFCALKHGVEGQPLTVSGLNQAIDKLASRAGVTGRCNPHSFRHGFARVYLENGGDLATLAQLMGHCNVGVTASFYAVFTGDELARRHRELSPLRDRNH